MQRGAFDSDLPAVTHRADRPVASAERLALSCVDPKERSD
jgi:hypothetical protein